MVWQDISGEASLKAIEWTFFVLSYIIIGLRLSVRLAHQQQSRVLISDMFLFASALVCLGLITCMHRR
ncbi:hypothetical protein E4T44_08413 [Aureobasidium sp. EXF-8845]|nr:hypothetical protein E4T44_08413 [Aureobasidium sp. EXF-8845]